LSPITTLEQETLTLDPRDWETVRHAAHEALDQVLDVQQNIRERPTWRPVPRDTEAFLAKSAPKEGMKTDAVVARMLEHIVPYPAGHHHPRFWGWVCGTGSPVGMIADMLAAGINASAGVFNDAPSRVENQVLTWMRDLFGFPETASGIITSGCSVANMIGLAVGRDAVLQTDIPVKGLSGVKGTPVVYASSEVHSSVDKGMQFLGLGRQNLCRIPVDEAFRFRADLLEKQIQKDRAAGLTPIAVIATAGTVNTGSLDDLSTIGEVARRHGLWFHVDAAIGGLAMMSPNLRPHFKGIELADSLAFDFHKWLYVPYEAGCVLIRDAEKHRRSFSVAASYLEPIQGGLAAWSDSSNMRGPQLSRGFKALKVWAQIMTYGLEKLGRLQDQNVAHIRYLADRVDAEQHLERLAAVPLNILNFRFTPPSLPEETWDAVNREILVRLQEEGIAVPSSTRINGTFALRVANTNHRTRREDFDLLVRETLRIGHEIDAQAPGTVS
jgi:glutamate/tyrosine decarboxylase-like PLP-dependent enzyme